MNENFRTYFVVECIYLMGKLRPFWLGNITKKDLNLDIFQKVKEEHSWMYLVEQNPVNLKPV